MHLPFVSNPELLQEEITDLATLGVVFLMFMAGLEVELSEMLHSGRASVLSGIVGRRRAAVHGRARRAALRLSRRSAAWFIGIILTATSVSISAQTLLELGVLRTREGSDAARRGRRRRCAGAARAVDLSGAEWLATNRSGVVVIKMLGYLTLSGAAGLVRAAPRRDVDRSAADQRGAHRHRAVSHSGVRVVGRSDGRAGGDHGRVHRGRGTGPQPAARQDRDRRCASITYGFLVPIFFVSIGLEANLRAITGALLPFLIVLFIVAVRVEGDRRRVGRTPGRIQQCRSRCAWAWA